MRQLKFKIQYSKRILIPVFFVFLIFYTTTDAVAGTSLLKKSWIQVDTDNFVVISAMDKYKTEKLATDLEKFRFVFSMITNSAPATEKVKTYIYSFPRSIPEIGLNWTYAGLFKQLMRGNYVFLKDSGANQNTYIIQHEYTHFMLHNHNALEYPPWYDEGFAELLATIKIKNNKIVFGKPLKARADSLSYYGWQPYRWIINVTNVEELKDIKVIMFYAQSWALLHYLSFGREGHNFTKETTKFLYLLTTGMSKDDAFEQAYSEDLETLTGKIRKYVSGKIKYLRLVPNTPFPEFSIKTEKLAKDVVASKIGYLCLINGEFKCAEEYYNESLKINPNEASSLIGLADLRKFEGKYDEAEPGYKRAIEIEPDVAMHYLDYAEYFQDRAKAAESADEQKKWLLQARKFYHRSLDMDPYNPEILVQYGTTFFVNQEEVLEGLSYLVTAHKYLPANPQLKLALAEGYARAGMYDDARKLAERVLSWSHTDASKAAEKFLSWLDDIESKNNSLAGSQINDSQ